MKPRAIEAMAVRLALTGLAVAGIVGAGLPGATADASLVPRAVLSSFSCVHALDPADRSVSVTSVMRPVPGTRRAAVKFTLLKRDKGATAWQPVSGSGLGTWISRAFGQHPGDVWRVIHPVSDLGAPAAYRFTVVFRWTGSAAHVMARAIRFSRVCHQPELRPDLEVLSVSLQADPLNSQADDYGVRIRNAGVTGAGPFRIQLNNQGVLVNRRIRHIDGHTTRVVNLVGPVCQSADPPTVTADPAHRVDVYSRAQATLTASCPAASGASGG